MAGFSDYKNERKKGGGQGAALILVEKCLQQGVAFCVGYVQFIRQGLASFPAAASDYDPI